MYQKHIAKSPEFFTSHQITNLFGTELLPPDPRPLPVPLRVAARPRCGVGAGGGIGHVGGGGGGGVAGGHHVVLVEVGAVATTNGPVNILRFFCRST